MDSCDKITIRTPYAISVLRQPNSPFAHHPTTLSFSACRGIAQGDSLSNPHWISYADIGHRAIQLLESPIFLRTLLPCLQPAPEIGFIDDEISPSPNSAAQQIKTDIYSTNSIVTGLTFNIPKFRALSTCPPPLPTPPTIIVHTGMWRPTHIQPQVSGTFKYLGYTHTIGTKSQQPTLPSQLTYFLNIVSAKRAPQISKLVWPP